MSRIIILVLILLPAICFAQADQKEHEQVMERFVRYYNNGSGDSLCTMFGHTECSWKTKQLPYPQYGKIESYQFVEFYNGTLAVFKVVHAKAGVKAMSFRLNGDKFGGFSFNDISPQIVQLIEEK